MRLSYNRRLALVLFGTSLLLLGLMSVAKALDSERRPSLRGPMPTKGLRVFQKRVARQVRKHPNDVLVEAVTEQKRIALTFDDGPDPVMTPRLLKILDDADVKATFFLVGERVETWPELVSSIHKAGHRVAGHGYTHSDLSKLGAAEAIDKHLRKTNELLQDLVGYTPGYFRPPYGAVTDEQLGAFATAGFKTALWSVDSLDWSPRFAKARRIQKRVIEQAHPGAIVLLHSGRRRAQTAKALPGVIATLKGRGYEFVTLNELLVTSPTQ